MPGQGSVWKVKKFIWKCDELLSQMPETVWLINPRGGIIINYPKLAYQGHVGAYSSILCQAEL